MNLFTALQQLSTVPLPNLIKLYDYIVHYKYTGSIEDIVIAIKRLHGLPSSVSINSDLINAITQTKRCGCSDRMSDSTTINQWLKSKAHTGIGYFVSSYVIDRAKQDTDLIEAFSRWERVCNVSFIKLSSGAGADILISGSSLKSEEFGTPGNVLAWSYLPQGPTSVGQLLFKFDAAESWDTGIDLKTVATHEIGHLLGLDHTQIQGELMYPIYNPAVGTPQSRYDIPEVVKRYDQPVNQPSVPTPPVVPTFTLADLSISIKGRKLSIS